MKKTLLILLAVIFLSCVIINSGRYTKSVIADLSVVYSKYTVVIDAGHGGRDAGTTGFDGTAEKGINLSIALILYDYLMVSGINAVLVRNGDYELYAPDEQRVRSDLYNRLDFINSVKNSILISIHQNHFEDPAEWGCQVWYSANTEESKVLADNILSSVKEFLQPENERLNKQSDNSYYLLYKASRPSVMVECGFMSNENENRLLQDKNYQKNMAFAILAGVCGEV